MRHAFAESAKIARLEKRRADRRMRNSSKLSREMAAHPSYNDYKRSFYVYELMKHIVVRHILTVSTYP